MASTPEVTGFTKEELDEVVAGLKKALSSEELRKLNQRAVQGKVWHLQPEVYRMMSKLRGEEEVVRQQVMDTVSKLVYRLHEHTLDTTLARAGLMQDKRLHAGSSLDKTESFDLFCLDAKERLYVVMKDYGWLQDFFRLYPLHFYENSFQFVDRIPKKKLKVKVNVVGLGIGGSMAVSGLAKAGIEVVHGYEKRNESGPSSVGSRYQNASWRAYDVAEKLLDEEAYHELVKYRQRFNVQYDDGTTGVITSDRVQIILGSAIEHSLASAKRYGAALHFGTTNVIDAMKESDIVALFAGAHTSEICPELKREMGIMSWTETDSDCKMWLRIKASEKKDFFCTRGGEIGAENWNYTIESARDTAEDIVRVRSCLVSQQKSTLRKLDGSGEEKQEALENFEAQVKQLDDVKAAIDEGKTAGGRFDYIFTNAPTNPHNWAKRDEAAKDGSIVLEGGYRVEVKIASNSKFTSEEVVGKFQTGLVVCGGDACVPPNPQAAYGATLACENAGMLVQLAVGYGHLNAILEDMEKMKEFVDDDWVEELKKLKNLLSEYYNARGRSENYFQFVQTLICNLYSLPPFTE
jgi:hypothetical protein